MKVNNESEKIIMDANVITNNLFSIKKYFVNLSILLKPLATLYESLPKVSSTSSLSLTSISNSSKSFLKLNCFKLNPNVLPKVKNINTIWGNSTISDISL